MCCKCSMKCSMCCRCMAVALDAPSSIANLYECNAFTSPRFTHTHTLSLSISSVVANFGSLNEPSEELP